MLPLAEVSLFLDLDGTLTPIVARPDLVGPDTGRNRLLSDAAQALDGRLAIISGRSIEDIDRITESCARCVAGLHGLERRSLRAHETTAPHPELGEAVALIEAFARLRPGLLVEKKRLAVSLHYRETPGLGAETLAFARRTAWATGLKLQEGDMVAELRCPGATKGDVLKAFMEEQPFAGHVPVFVGDDVTDEDGFAAAQELGGYGVLVGKARETSALCRLEDVQDVLRWLETSLASASFSLAADR